MIPGIFEDTYKYRQYGLTITFVTVPVQLMAFAPGFSTGNSPFMWLFIRVVPWQASFSTESMTMVFCKALTWPSSLVTSAVASAYSSWYRSRFCLAAMVAESVSPRESR